MGAIYSIRTSDASGIYLNNEESLCFDKDLFDPTVRERNLDQASVCVDKAIPGKPSSPFGPFSPRGPISPEGVTRKFSSAQLS